MSQAVIIKSNKSGIHLILDKEMSFQSLLNAVVEKFKESDKFFKGAKLAISFEGRELTPEQENAIIDAITANTSIEILCIVDNDPAHEAYVTSIRPASLSLAPIWSKYLEDTPMTVASFEEDTVFDSFAKQRTRRIA